MALFAGKPTTTDQIRATLAYLKRLEKSEPARHREYMHVAINRKAGIPDVPAGRRWDPDYQWELYRDAQELRDHASWRRSLWGLNGRRWRTDIVQARLGHMLEDND